jgi:hypothetical protein
MHAAYAWIINIGQRALQTRDLREREGVLLGALPEWNPPFVEVIQSANYGEGSLGHAGVAKELIPQVEPRV